MGTVTLIGPRLAEAGTEFVFDGEAPACEGCPYRGQCLDLEVGRRYRVTDVRENAQMLECGVHDEGVVAVEVEPAGFRANVAGRSAYAGSSVELEGPCPHTGCPSHELCEPAGGAMDESYTIESVVGEPPHDYCHLGRELTTVKLAPPEE